MINLIELKNVTLQYRPHGRTLLVLQNINLNFQKGEMVAILGPSGSGKSTLLYILGCLLKPSSGEYSFAGKQMSLLTTEELADFRAQKIGFVFQQFHLLPRANLSENLLLSSRYAERSRPPSADLRKKAEELLTDVGLSDHLSHHPNELSGGQQQRVAIARALMNDADLILADEPTGNLDSQSAVQIIQLLRKIQQSGKTVIIITHDLDIANRCDRTIRVQDGTILNSTPPHQSLTQTLAQSLAQPAINSANVWRGNQSLPGQHPLQRPKWSESNWIKDILSSWQNLKRNKSRSLLTMLGVTIGVAAVLATITLGTYTEKKSLRVMKVSA